MSLKTPEYSSGSCNIGGPEVRRRKISGIIGAVLSLVFYLVAISVHASRGIRSLIFFPIVMATLGWFQSRRKFCVAFGLAGVFNFGELGGISHVENREAKSADRTKAIRTIIQATLVALVLALVLTLIPA